MQAGFVPADLQGNYQQYITRSAFACLVVKYIEVYLDSDIDTILSDRGLIGAANFSDTKDNNILAANALGIISGIGNNRMALDSEIMREQAAVMIAKMLGVLHIHFVPNGTPTIADFDNASPWAVGAIKHIVSNGITGGTSGGNFNPKDTFTREQAITVFDMIYSNLLDSYSTEWSQ